MAESHFCPARSAQPGFDTDEVEIAMVQPTPDGTACKMNLWGPASPAFAKGRMTPEDHELHLFHQWVLPAMELAP